MAQWTASAARDNDNDGSHRARSMVGLALILVAFVTWPYGRQFIDIYLYVRDVPGWEYIAALMPTLAVVTGMLVMPARWSRRVTAAVMAGTSFAAAAAIVWLELPWFVTGIALGLPFAGVAIAGVILRMRPWLVVVALLVLVPSLLLIVVVRGFVVGYDDIACRTDGGGFFFSAWEFTWEFGDSPRASDVSNDDDAGARNRNSECLEHSPSFLHVSVMPLAVVIAPVVIALAWAGRALSTRVRRLR